MAQMARKVIDYKRSQRNHYIEIIDSECSGEVEQYAVEISSQAMREFCDQEMDEMASFVRDQFDLKYGQYWNCLVGEVIEDQEDGGNAWDESENFVYLKNGIYYWAIYKTADMMMEESEHEGPIRLGVAESSQQRHYYVNRAYHKHSCARDHSGSQRSCSHSRSRSPMRRGVAYHHRGESGIQLLKKKKRDCSKDHE